MDNFFQSFLVFFMMITDELYDTVFYSAINIVGIDMEPKDLGKPMGSYCGLWICTSDEDSHIKSLCWSRDR